MLQTFAKIANSALTLLLKRGLIQVTYSNGGIPSR